MKTAKRIVSHYLINSRQLPCRLKQINANQYLQYYGRFAFIGWNFPRQSFLSDFVVLIDAMETAELYTTWVSIEPTTCAQFVSKHVDEATPWIILLLDWLKIRIYNFCSSDKACSILQEKLFDFLGN